jgi:murein DD-endopeptidase MepM/ murein hydrolase activator NlpD
MGPSNPAPRNVNTFKIDPASPSDKKEEPASARWASLWDALTHIGLRAPVMRYAGHLLILVVVASASWLARSSLLDLLPARIQVNPSASLQTATAVPAETTAVLPSSVAAGGDISISRSINPRTFLPDQPRSDVITYTVASGDTLFGIAAKFNLQPETLLWSNNSVLKDDPDLLTPGMILYILPVDGVYYQWHESDKLSAVAANYGVNVVDIVSWPGNHLNPNIDPDKTGISPDTWLIIPGGHREFVQWQVPVLRRTDKMKWAFGGAGACQGPYLSTFQGSGHFIWPTDSHAVTGNPYTSWHRAIDLFARMGDNVYASDTGVVVFSGMSSWGYGNLVVIDHGNGWQTVYAHLSVINSGCGADVTQGEVIGLAGSTGNSTGPHLHFEIQNPSYGYVNPLDFLPPA